jgi:hypothetical protein
VFLANLFSGVDQPIDINTLDKFFGNLTSRPSYDIAAGGTTFNMAEQEVLRLRGEVQRAFCAMVPESAFLKTHSRFGDQFGLPLIEPECTVGAIYIVRNPLDVVVSAASHFDVGVDAMARHMADPNFRTAASEKHVTDYIGSWSDAVASWTVPAHPKIHVVRYEDLYEAPEAEFYRIVSFLGLRPSSERFGNAVKYSQFSSLAEQERAEGFKERSPRAATFFRRGRPGEGREMLKAGLIDKIVSAHGAQMARFGYAKVGNF